MRLIIRPEYEDCSQWAANYIAYKINGFHPTAQKPFVLGLPTGSTPLGTYKALIELYKKGKVSLEFLQKYYLQDFISKPVVFYSGRIDKDKNLEVLIKAIPLVLKEKEVNFLFLGDGDINNDLKRVVESMNIEEHLRFIGPLQPTDSNLPQFYQLSSLFVIPSFIEGQSLATMEAMASGLPIVAANGGALKELVFDNENGFLVNPFSEKEFAEKILAVLSDEKLKKRMSQKSLELIKSHDISNTFKKLEEIYQRFA